MKSALQAKLLQHFAKKKNQNGGFTLIELLVVIVIVGILAAIALPSFLNQANKARASEAKANLGAMNSSQQAYWVEKGGWAPTVASLGAGIKDTTNYTYSVGAASGVGDGTSKGAATSAGASLKSYASRVAVDTSAPADPKFSVILCESTDVGSTGASAIGTTNTSGTLACSGGDQVK